MTNHNDKKSLIVEDTIETPLKPTQVKKNKQGKQPKLKAKNKSTTGLKVQRVIAIILLIGTTLGIIGGIGVFGLTLKNIKNATEIKATDFTVKRGTQLLDMNSTAFYDTAEKSSEAVSFDAIPQSLIDAFVAVEDSRFFVHKGFDVPRFTKAALTNLLESLKSGHITFEQGGSTLTMQLIKNQYFMENENAATGVNRKIQEIYLSSKLEREEILSKKSIFELYINMINYGVPRTIGAEKSAQAYFGKSLSEINVVESAFLAGVVNAPNNYTPYASIELANERTQKVLYLMNYHGYISDEEYRLAKTVHVEDLLISTPASEAEAYQFQAFADVVLAEAEELTGLNPTEVPMIIHTTMNPAIQAGIDKVQRREIDYLDHGKDRKIQVGSTVLNNHTGEIVGVVGGYDYNGALLFNRATALNSSPASVLKPHVAYAPAFEYQGISTTHVFTDRPMNYAGTDILIGNYDNRYLGEITLMHAAADSRNIPAIEAIQGTIDTLGRQKSIDYFHALGLTHFDDEKFGPAFAIGSGDLLASPTELAAANAVMFNDGKYIKPHTITKIEYPGQQRETYVAKHQPQQVLSPESAWMTTRIMKYAVESPYNPVIGPVRRDYPVFGKTGTNRYDTEETARAAGVEYGDMKDRLMITATSDYSIATWTGFDNKDPNYNPRFTDAEADINLTGYLNSYLLNLLEENYGTGSDVERPSGVADIKHILGTFPYQAPLADMNESLVTSGYIKRDFLKLAEASPQELKSLASQKVMSTEKNNLVLVDVKLSEYPDSSKLSVASNTLTMKYPDGRTVNGTKLYDPSWIFGAVRYKTEVRVNDNVVAEALTDKPVQELRFARPDAGSVVKVCSYYTFDKAPGRKSNIECTTLELKEPTFRVPNAGTNLDDMLSALGGMGFKQGEITVIYVLEGSRYNTVISASPNILGKEIIVSDYRDSGVQLSVSDVLISSSNYRKYSQYFTISDANPSAPVKGFKLEGDEVNEFRLSQAQGKTIEIVH